MLNSKPLQQMIFLDLETVPQAASFFDLSPRMQEAFLWKFKKEYAELGLGRKEHYIQEAMKSQSTSVLSNTVLSKDDIELNALFEMEADDRAKTEALYNNKASLFAEFGKIICCSVGWFDKVPTDAEGEYVFKTKSFFGDDEKELLAKFQNAFAKIIDTSVYTHHLCAHNGKVFDFPFMAKRFILNGLPLPKMFDLDGKKPWDLVHFVDTKEVWQFSVRDNAATLDLLCECFGVPSSKDDIKGSDVRRVYYEEPNGLERIVTYCTKDILALATVYLRMKSILNKVVLV